MGSSLATPMNRRCDHPTATVAALLLSGLVLRPTFSLAADVHVELGDVANSAVKQLRAEAVLDVAVERLFAAISDVERYAAFMPYVVESTVVARDAESIVNYQRLSFNIPLVAERHYAIRIRESRGQNSEGRAAYLIRWTLAPDVPVPDHASAVAVSTNSGFWYLRDVGTQTPQTQVLYCVYTDPGGQLPAWIVNRANVEAVPRVFEAIGAAARDPRYTVAQPKARPDATPIFAPASCESGA